VAPDKSRRCAALRQLYGVVESARRAGASGGGAGEDEVARLGELGQDRGRRRRRRVRLLPVQDPPDAVPLAEEGTDVVDEPVEVRLVVVDEADRASGEVGR